MSTVGVLVHTWYFSHCFRVNGFLGIQFREKSGEQKVEEKITFFKMIAHNKQMTKL